MSEATISVEAEATDKTGRHVRVHWHDFWSGKMIVLEERKFRYRWLPPQLIGGNQ